MREARTFLERLLLAAALPRGEMAGSVGMVCLSVTLVQSVNNSVAFGIEAEQTSVSLLLNGAFSVCVDVGAARARATPKVDPKTC